MMDLSNNQTPEAKKLDDNCGNLEAIAPTGISYKGRIKAEDTETVLRLLERYDWGFKGYENSDKQIRTILKSMGVTTITNHDLNMLTVL